MKRSINNLVPLVLSICYALIWVFSDAISNVNFYQITDRLNYLYYADNGADILVQRFYNYGYLALFNEPLFLVFMSSIRSIANDSDFVVRILIAFNSIVSSYLCIKNTKNYYLSFLVLMLPQVYVNNVMSLRQGFAVSLFLMGWFSSNTFFKYLFVASTVFVHSSFILTLAIIGVSRVSISLKVKPIYYTALSFLLYSVLMRVALKFAEILGVRQSEGYLNPESIEFGIGFGFWFWLFVLFVMVSGCNKILSNIVINSRNIIILYYISIGAIVFYLASYLQIPALSRTIQNHAVLVFVMVPYLDTARIIIMLCALTFYFIFNAYQILFGGLLVGFV